MGSMMLYHLRWAFNLKIVGKRIFTIPMKEEIDYTDGLPGVTIIVQILW